MPQKPQIIGHNIGSLAFCCFICFVKAKMPWLKPHLITSTQGCNLFQKVGGDNGVGGEGSEPVFEI